MAQKATHRQTDSSSPVPVVLFGVDENGKPKAARFTDKHANLATKAAGHLKLHVLPIVGPVAVDLAGRLPSGRIHANGRGFVPYIRRDLYTKLMAAAGSSAQGDHASTQAAAASGSTKTSSQNGHGDFPKNWDEIAPGHVVIALDEPGEGWYETIVVETSGDMLTLRWRDYPRERRITRHRLSVGCCTRTGCQRATPIPVHQNRSLPNRKVWQNRLRQIRQPLSRRRGTTSTSTVSCSLGKMDRGGVGGRRSRPTRATTSSCCGGGTFPRCRPSHGPDGPLACCTQTAADLRQVSMARAVTSPSSNIVPLARLTKSSPASGNRPLARNPRFHHDHQDRRDSCA
jgi:hypothetical protein